MKIRLLTTTFLISTFALHGCGQKTDQTANQSRAIGDNQAQPVEDKQRGYMQEIEGLSQVGVNVTNGEYPLATEHNAAFNAKAADIQARIKADPTLEGSETVGKKAEMLKALSASMMSNSPSFRVVRLNDETNKKLENHMLRVGKSSLSEAEVQQAVMARKGVDGWLKLREGDFTSNVESMF